MRELHVVYNYKCPMNALPDTPDRILKDVDYCLVTQLHFDHFCPDYLPKDLRIITQNHEDNVRLLKPDASEEEVMEALKAAQCMDIIDKLPNGIHTMIGEKGTYLSGGEQQRITSLC